MTVRVDPRPLSLANGPDIDAALVAALRVRREYRKAGVEVRA